MIEGISPENLPPVGGSSHEVKLSLSNSRRSGMSQEKSLDPQNHRNKFQPNVAFNRTRKLSIWTRLAKDAEDILFQYLRFAAKLSELDRIIRHMLKSKGIWTEVEKEKAAICKKT